MPYLRNSFDLEMETTDEPINYYLLLTIFFMLFFSINFISCRVKGFSYINNLVHLFHSICIINLYNSEQYYIGTIFSLAFFFSDTIKLVFMDNVLKKLPYIIHHIIAFFVLNIIYSDYNNLQEDAVNTYILLEFSNIPLYLNYFVIKLTDNNKYKYFKIRKIATLIQLIWYGYYRIFAFGFIILSNLNRLLNQEYIISLITLIIYSMGIYWTSVLINQIKNCERKPKNI